MGGLAIATLLTLIFLPALYVAWFHIESPAPDAKKVIAPEQPAAPTVF
jgi:hypothetical protein